MTKDQITAVFERVRTWPEKRQEDAARVLLEMEEQDKSTLRLTDEQAAEVRRRLADPNRKTIPAEEVFKRFRSTSA
jgi:urease accessory protein UreE